MRWRFVGQFKAYLSRGPIQIVVSEIVIQEILQHLISKTIEAKGKFFKASKAAMFHKLIPFTSAYFGDADPDPSKIARERLVSFLREIGAERISEQNASMTEIVQMYFSGRAPFALTGKKKAEFPDGIALLSLEQWARENGKEILAVSGDKGWAEYAEKSPCITVVSDLGIALSSLHQQATAMATAQKLLSDIATHSNGTLACAVQWLIDGSRIRLAGRWRSGQFIPVEVDYVQLMNAELSTSKRERRL
ncbi:MAG: PIN domain-containing protein [Methylovirgula sp.]|uniref:PIN domain-containing protein n=1 Tax=Methylovirgula sp. TaxID=1978224 RepID=UPI003076488A